MDFENIIRISMRNPKVYKVVNTGDETTGDIWGVTEENMLPVAWFKDNTDAHFWCLILNERAETRNAVLKSLRTIVKNENKGMEK